MICLFWALAALCATPFVYWGLVYRNGKYLAASAILGTIGSAFALSLIMGCK